MTGQPTTRVEYRTLGVREGYGTWDGAWRGQEPTESELRGYLKRSIKVWVERREVTESQPEVVIEYERDRDRGVR